jgi:uncharacterized membrane protein
MAIAWIAREPPAENAIRQPAASTTEEAMEVLARFHPQIVHTPIALIIIALAFDLIGRATRLEWWRKAAFAMLVVGVLGAGGAVLSGREAGEAAERQGVPEQPVDAHEEMAFVTLALGLAAVAARGIASRAGGARALVSGIALVLHLGAAIAVGITGYRGGKLVYEYGAAVHLHGQPASSGAPHAEEHEGERGERR